MEYTPKVVHYVDWDIVCKCKTGHYGSIDACLKSIWTEEYGNPIEEYNIRTMIQIMGGVLEEILTIKQRAFLFDRILRSDRLDSQEALLRELFYALQLLTVRESYGIKSFRDLYIIDKKGKYYTIAEYDELKGDSNGQVQDSFDLL